MDRGRKIADGTVAELALARRSGGRRLEPRADFPARHRPRRAMLRASLYITLCTAKNRLLVRLRRLREPRYLICAIAGAAYMYFAVFMRIGAGRRTRRGSGEAPDVLARSVRTLAPAAGGVGAAGAGRGRLGLAGAQHAVRLFRGGDPSSFSGTGDAPGAVDPSAGAVAVQDPVRRGRPGVRDQPQPDRRAGGRVERGRLLRVVAFWIVFVTFRVYFAGVTLARARLTSADARSRWTAWPPIVAIAAAVAIVGVPVGRSLLDPPLESLGDLMPRIAEATASGLPHLVLWPFVTLMQAAVRRSPRGADGGTCRRADRVDRDARVGSAQRRGVSRRGGRSAVGRSAARRRSHGRRRCAGDQLAAPAVGVNRGRVLLEERDGGAAEHEGGRAAAVPRFR